QHAIEPVYLRPPPLQNCNFVQPNSGVLFIFLSITLSAATRRNGKAANQAFIGYFRVKDEHRRFAYNILSRYQFHFSTTEDMKADGSREDKDSSDNPVTCAPAKRTDNEFMHNKFSSDYDNLSDTKWKLEFASVTKTLEPVLEFCKRALPGTGIEDRIPPISRSLAEILASIQKSKAGIQDWSLSDLTIGLYLMYIHQASANPLEDVQGVQISSEPVVHDLIYHLELAKGCYKDSAACLAKYSMLREINVLKFVKVSSMLRPGYYIAIDPRKKLVILGIRGTHSVYDLITDIVSSSNEEVTFEGYSTHFGVAESARWFLTHEMKRIKKCLDENKGFRLRLVGHSLGAATASLLAVMLRKKSCKELGFDPDRVTAVGFATPPCVSKELAESCSDFINTVVMQDDIVPRLSIATLARLRNEIVQTDWRSVLEKEDWKSVVEFVTNAQQVMSSVQDVARKVADYAKFRGITDSSDAPPEALNNSPPTSNTPALPKKEEAKETAPHNELFVPGTVYYLKRNFDSKIEYFTLWKRNKGQHFQRILLSNKLISNHKCDSHYHALRDVLKGLPFPCSEESIFR
ncbi:hypothetical protein V2J09_015642, partial [Rumex salicifolius]